MRSLAAVLAIIFLLPADLFSQQPYVESIEVRIANVEVVVTDAQGRHVRDLPKSEFELIEDGVPQPITNFFEQRDDSKPLPVTAGVPVESPISPDPAEKSRYYVIFIDDYSVDPLRRKPLFDALERFVERTFRPGDKAMVVTWNSTLKIELPFSSDPAAIKSAIQAAMARSAGGYMRDRRLISLRNRSEVQEAAMSSGGRGGKTFPEAYTNSVTFTRQFAEEQNNKAKNLMIGLEETLRTLAVARGRKALVFAGQNLPGQVARDVFVEVDELFLPYASQMRGVTLGSLVMRAAEYTQSLRQQHLAESANKFGVALYMIHPSAPEMESSADGMKTSETVRFEQFTNTAASFVELAKRTGGLALVAGNDFDQVFDVVSRDLGSFYSLGYKPPEGKTARRVSVRTKNPAHKVRFRNTVSVRPVEDEARDAVVSAAFTTPPNQEIDLTLNVSDARPAGRGKRIVPLEIRIRADQVTLLPDDGGWAGSFTVLIAAAEAKGSFSEVSTRKQVVRSATLPQRGEYITYAFELNLRTNDQIVSIAVIDDATKAVGYVKSDLSAVKRRR